MNLEKYRIVTVPSKYNVLIDKTNRTLSKEYSNWILSIKDERISYLKDYLSENGMQLDYSNQSLKEFFDWFKKNIQFRERTDEELKEYEKFKDVIIENRTFTTESVSLIFDTALFWGDCLINKMEQLRWFANKTNDGDIGYAFPIIGIRENDGVNPRQLIEVVAYKLMDGKDLEDEFNELLNIWISMF